MGKSQTQQATADANQLFNQAQTETAPILSGFKSSLGTQQANQASEFSNLQPNINQNMTTGGYDPSTLSSIMGGYSGFANTGGYTPTQANQFMQQATEGTGTTYNALENQAKRSAVATGGLGTSGGLSQMARQLGQVQGQNTVNAETSLNEQINANKLSGLSGEASTEANVAGNKTAATAQANQLYNTTTGQITALGNQMLQTLGLQFNTQSQAIDALTQLSKNPGLFQTFMGDMASAGGSAAGA